MGVFSILPDHLSVIETWLVRLFIVLAAITIGPWLIMLLYDFGLYAWRSATYDLPGIGGRTRGKGHPRPPSFVEHFDGNKRSLGIRNANGFFEMCEGVDDKVS
ncbi:hypothetical protein K470DRAFT_254756 [Piedraia hortae CBS 480.64]|uniref:Uncharacterized protein n=1 Tax=Piedraia hortae CBS 480.64 TaxID=1314780 RepID=A0A6A7C9I3_9PEZI|nr:hypothetical protein K470DRAFT_254756 [Piedraia hortae CBS 480.64]